MAQLKDLVIFRDDLYFNGAVQADWFYQSRQVEAVAKSFVFHGPKNHAVSQNEFGGQGLLDTASFTLRLAQKMGNADDNNALTLAIAGYGTGKSHLAVTLSTLFSGEQWMSELHEEVLANIARADADIEKQLCPLVKKPRLVLTINGMHDFNLHYELLRTAEKALTLYDADLSVLSKLNKVKEIATVFIERSFDILADRFENAATKHGISLSGITLKQHLLQSLGDEPGAEFEIVNDVYTEFNGHPIRMDEGVSASLVLDTLLSECCGLHGQFDGIVILFDEFGRFLEYVSANPAAAGDSALQQIFESVQNAEGDIQFIGFIQSDIKSYLQRVDKSSNISRYIDRYDAGEKIYLSSNLETIFANLLEKKNRAAFDHYVTSRLRDDESSQRTLFLNLQKWLPLHGIWNQWNDYRRIILEEIYPLHPISTYLLCNLTDWLQSRSSLTLLSEKLRLMGNQTVDLLSALPTIYPVDLLKGAFFDELLNAEEQGRQRSQFCILLNSIYRKFDTKLTDDARSVLLANLILRICRFHFESREELFLALQECTGLMPLQIKTAIDLLENEYAVLSYDDRLICFDFVADSVGANEFRNFLKAAQYRRIFRPEMLMQNDIQEMAEVLKPIDTDFGTKHGIQTREWSFIQRIEQLQDSTGETVFKAYKELQTHTLPNTERGLLLWLYISKETPVGMLDHLTASMGSVDRKQALVLMAIDDTDNSLQDAILSYRVLADMKEEDKIRYQRFYADAYEKAREKVTLLFADLKQQRKVITTHGIESVAKRLKVYLTSVFEDVYPRAVPFDFEGFDAKGATGAAYKNFCTIMKWILMDGMSYVSLKSQSSDVKNRIDSLLGPHGIYSWRALSNDYKSVAPSNGEISRLYNALETILNTKKVIPFKHIITQLTASPYGMNEYSAFMFLCLFSELYSYTTRFELNGSRYSTNAWAEEVLQDKKFDAKLFNKTKLLLIDVGETVSRYRNIYTKIKKNTDFAKVSALREELEKLKQEEAVPEALEAEDELATDRLSEGDRLCRIYTDQMAEIAESFSKAERILNPYNALRVALDVQTMEFETLGSGKYVYSAAQTEEMDNYVKMAMQVAAKSFEDGWIKRYACQGPEKLGMFKNFSAKAAELFSRYGFVKESTEFIDKVDQEVARIKLIIEQEAFINSCETYLLSSKVQSGMTQRNLAAFQSQGNELLNSFEKFDYETDKHCVSLRSEIDVRVKAITEALTEFKIMLDGIWDAVYDVSNIEDAKHVHARIVAVLNSGLTDRDREDLESVDRDISSLIDDISELAQHEYSRESLTEACDSLSNQYDGRDFDVSLVLAGFLSESLERMNAKEQHWSQQYLTIAPEELDQHELDKWKHDTQPIPLYISKGTAEEYQIMYEKVEKELTKQRVSYVVLLFNQLSPEEKKMVTEQISKFL